MRSVLAVVCVELVACASPPEPMGHSPAPMGTARTAQAATAVQAKTKAKADVSPAKSCIDDGEPFDAATLRARVEQLASKKLDGRVPGTAGDRTARALIAKRFACLGLHGAGPDGAFELPFEVGGAETANIVGYLPGSDPDVDEDIIYVVAHFDHEGHGHLGANDNASGVAGLLAIAQAVQQRETKPRRTIAFAAFGAEELGEVGSDYLARHPPKALPNDRVVQLVNLDMIGTHDGRGFVAAMGAFRTLASRPIVDRLAKKFPRIRIATGGRARGSDFEPLCKRGVPYVFLWTPDPRCYHRACDTADRLDYRHMRDIAAFANALVDALADSDHDLAAARAEHGCGI